MGMKEDVLYYRTIDLYVSIHLNIQFSILITQETFQSISRKIFICNVTIRIYLDVYFLYEKANRTKNYFCIRCVFFNLNKVSKVYENLIFNKSECKEIFEFINIKIVCIHTTYVCCIRKYLSFINI